MHWKLFLDPSAEKSLSRIPKKDANRLFSVMRSLAVNPYAGDIEKMEGEEDVWRRRVGVYRVFYEIHKARRIIYVFKVKRRTSKTY